MIFNPLNIFKRAISTTPVVGDWVTMVRDSDKKLIRATWTTIKTILDPFYQPLPDSRLHTSVSLAVNTARKPSTTKDVLVVLTPRLTAGIGATSRVNFQVDDSGGGTYITIAFAENTNTLTVTLGLLGGSSTQVQPITVKVPKGSNYKYTTTGTVTIESIYELTEW